MSERDALDAVLARLARSGPLAQFAASVVAPVAFVLAGQMAVAYFWIHVGRGDLWWWDNGGELAMMFSFVFLFFSAWGAGPFSLDAKLAARRES